MDFAILSRYSVGCEMVMKMDLSIVLNMTAITHNLPTKVVSAYGLLLLEFGI